MATSGCFSGLAQRAHARAVAVLQPETSAQFAVRTSELIHPDSLLERLGTEAAGYSVMLDSAPESFLDGIGDAFRHAYAAGKLSSGVGSWGAQSLGLLHEIVAYPGDFRNYRFDFSHTNQALLMDIVNNARGVEIAEGATSNDEFAARLFMAIVAGRMKVLEERDLGDGEKAYRVRDTDGRDVPHFEWDRVDPNKHDDPQDDFFGPDPEDVWA